MGHDVADQIERSSARSHARAPGPSLFRLHRQVCLSQTSHWLLTPFVDDAERRSHDGSHANLARIEINRKKPATLNGERYRAGRRPDAAPTIVIRRIEQRISAKDEQMRPLVQL